MVNNWHEVTLKQYYDYAAIQKSNKSDTEKTLDILALFSDVDNFEELKLSELGAHTPDLSFLLEPPASVQIGDTIELNGKTYNVATEKTLTALQFIEYQNTARVFDENKYSHVAAMVGILLTEQGKQFSKDGRIGSDEVGNLPCEVAFSLLSFFLPKSLRLLSDSPRYFARIAAMTILNANSTAETIFFLDTAGLSIWNYSRKQPE